MVDKLFESHGHFKVSVQNNTIRVLAFGPFNTQAVSNYKNDLILAIQQIEGPWTQLNQMHQNCLYTPEAQQKMHHLTQFRKDQGLVAAAFIFKDCFGTIILQEQLSGIYNKAQIPCQFFDDSATANLWLQQQIDSSI